MDLKNGVAELICLKIANTCTLRANDTQPNLFFQLECMKTVTNLWRNEFPPEVCVKYNLFARTRLPNLNSEFLIKRVAKRKRRAACALLLNLISDLLLLWSLKCLHTFRFTRWMFISLAHVTTISKIGSLKLLQQWNKLNDLLGNV